MAKNEGRGEQNTDYLLRYLLALELWRAGLSQEEIRRRLGMSMNVLNDMLKGVSRTVKLETPK